MLFLLTKIPSVFHGKHWICLSYLFRCYNGDLFHLCLLIRKRGANCFQGFPSYSTYSYGFTSRSCKTSSQNRLLSTPAQDPMLKKHIDYLAGAELQGRDTGTIGALKAADYIAKQFKASNLQPVADKLGLAKLTAQDISSLTQATSS